MSARLNPTACGGYWWSSRRSCRVRNENAAQEGHPSGTAEPSAADRTITHQPRDALQLVGVRVLVLDHLVVGSGKPTSMAERDLI